MARPRFYVPADCIGAETVPLTSAVVKHAIRVLRLSQGDPIFLFDGKGLELEAELAKDEKRNYIANIVKSRRLPRDSQIQLSLFQAPVKKERWEWLLEKSTELGVSSITPLITQFTEIDMANNFLKKKTRWESILQAACEQCGRSFLPELLSPISLKEAFKKAPGARVLFHPGTDTLPWKQILPLLKEAEKISLFIGPKGGFSPEEIQLAKSQNVPQVSLGKFLLRSETAGIAALACLSAWLS